MQYFFTSETDRETGMRLGNPMGTTTDCNWCGGMWWAERERERREAGLIKREDFCWRASLLVVIIILYVKLSHRQKWVLFLLVKILIS